MGGGHRWRADVTRTPTRTLLRPNPRLIKGKTEHETGERSSPLRTQRGDRARQDDAGRLGHGMDGGADDVAEASHRVCTR
jgi:hypothetical protein